MVEFAGDRQKSLAARSGEVQSKESLMDRGGLLKSERQRRYSASKLSGEEIVFSEASIEGNGGESASEDTARTPSGRQSPGSTDDVPESEDDTLVSKSPSLVDALPVRPVWMNRRSDSPDGESSPVGQHPADVSTESAATDDSPETATPSIDGGESRRPERPTRKSRSEKKKEAATAGGIKLAIDNEPEPELPWHRQLIRWFVGFAAVGYGISLLFHFTVFTLLSLIIIVPKLMNGPASLTALPAEGIDTTVDSLPMGMEDAGGGEDASTPVEVANLEVVRSVQGDLQQMLQPDVPSEFGADEAADGKSQGNGSGNSKGDGDGDGKGLPFAMPKGGAKVAQKGSFSAWTIPNDPRPGENYRIIIQIEMPDNVKRIPKRDLLGSFIQGTDGYAARIPTDLRGYFPGNNKQVQVVVFVPGASALVRDTIKLKSRILKEEQTLEIVF